MIAHWVRLDTKFTITDCGKCFMLVSEGNISNFTVILEFYLFLFSFPFSSFVIVSFWSSNWPWTQTASSSPGLESQARAMHCLAQELWSPGDFIHFLQIWNEINKDLLCREGLFYIRNRQKCFPQCQRLLKNNKFTKTAVSKAKLPHFPW